MEVKMQYIRKAVSFLLLTGLIFLIGCDRSDITSSSDLVESEQQKLQKSRNKPSEGTRLASVQQCLDPDNHHIPGHVPGAHTQTGGNLLCWMYANVRSFQLNYPGQYGSCSATIGIEDMDGIGHMFVHFSPR